MEVDYIKMIIPIALAVLGWIIGHFFTSRRDLTVKRRDMTTEHLINAYRILTNDISHRPDSKKKARKLENILSDIQLFGSIEQIELARSLADTVANRDSYELDSLINSLRDDLRKQLKLKPFKENVRWLRFNSQNWLCPRQRKK